MRLILASASPRRSELLKQLGVEFSCIPADIDESRLPKEKPEDYVRRVASEKAQVVAAAHSDNCENSEDWAVLAADTSVVLDDDVLGKPVDHFDGLAMLARLNGRQHSVLTAICLQLPSGDSHSEVVETKVEFLQLTREQCEAYLATDEPWDKAGGYAIQGLAGAFVRSIRGSYSNVVGLPLSESWQLLRTHGIATALEKAGE